MKDVVFIVVLVALVVFSGFQTMEITTLKESVSFDTPGPEAKTVQKSSGSEGYNLPNNLENLNTMVGGC